MLYEGYTLDIRSGYGARLLPAGSYAAVVNPAARWPLVSFVVLVLGLELLILLARPEPAVMPFALVLVPAIAATAVAGFGGGRPALVALVGRRSRGGSPRVGPGTREGSYSA